jgi:hypothetical protein
MVKVNWRRSPWHPDLDPVWLELPTPLEPGGRRRFELEMRRPLSGRLLVVEPHLQGGSGFGTLGGPAWRRLYV